MISLAKNLSRKEFSWENFKNFCLILSGIVLCLFVIQTGILIVTYLLPFRTVEAEKITVPGLSAPKIETLESFENKISVRNLFFSPAVSAPVAAPSGIDEKVKNLKLIGVITTGEPEAIVKDTQLNQTFFLKQHHRLRDLEVKAVDANSVIFKYGNEERKLFLE